MNKIRTLILALAVTLGCFTLCDAQTNFLTLATIFNGAGQMISSNAAGTPVMVPAGTSGQVLSVATTGVPAFASSFGGQGQLFQLDTGTNRSGAGTTQGSGTLLTRTVNELVTISAGVNEAFLLPPAVVGQQAYLFNAHATAAAKIFPSTGDQICAGGGSACSAANAVYSLAALKNLFCVAVTVSPTAKWYCNLGA